MLEEQLSPLSRPNQWDVVVVGGGIAGAAFAALLGSDIVTRPLRVAVLERRPPQPRPASAPPVRVSAIAARTRRAFEQIGIWDDVKAESCPYQSMVVWDSMIGGARLQFDQESPESPLGHIIPNDTMQSALFKRVQELGESSGVELFTGVSVRSVSIPDEDQPQWTSVECDDGQIFHTRLVVGADGARSQVKQFAKIGTFGFGYNQMGLVATVATDESPSDKTAWQRYLPTGPLALLPLLEQQSSIVWSLPTTDANRLKSLPKQEFLDLINRCLSSSADLASPFVLAESNRSILQFARQPLRSPVPKILDVLTDRFLFPLHLRQSDTYARHRVALIGDAAHYTHPQAGQGLNQGVADSIDLADCLKNAYGQDIGSMHVLQHYSTEACRRNATMLAGVHMIHKAYSCDHAGPLAALRNLGLDLINASPDAKKCLMRFATGELFSSNSRSSFT